MKNANAIKAKNQIAILFGISQYEHHVFIEKAGLKWLDYFFNPYNSKTKYWAKQYPYSKKYWNWFKMQYNLSCYEVLTLMGYDVNENYTAATGEAKRALQECFYEKQDKMLSIYPGMPIMVGISQEVKEKEVQNA